VKAKGAEGKVHCSVSKHVATIIMDALTSACCFPDLFQSIYTPNAFHLCLHIIC